MVCQHCHAESATEFDFCSKCGEPSGPVPTALADPIETPVGAKRSRRATFSVAVSLLTLVGYLFLPYISTPATGTGISRLAAFSIDGWQMNWLASWQFWPTAGRWICLSLITLLLVTALQVVGRSTVAAASPFADLPLGSRRFM